MRFLKQLFGHKKYEANKNRENKQEKNSGETTRNENCIKLLELQTEIDSILGENIYIARSDYTEKMKAYTEVIHFFEVIDDSGMLDNFCVRNGMTEREVRLIMDRYLHIGDYVEAHNEDYISSAMDREKEYLDNILKQVDPLIVLDEDQRRAVLTDEDYCLVIAGAGAGKTTTVAAKVKYLVDNKKSGSCADSGHFIYEQSGQ